MSDLGESMPSSIWKKFCSTITIEPMIFLQIFAGVLIQASEMNTNLLIHKMCVAKLQYNESICNHLDLPENEEYENEVQKRVNNFQMVGQWIGCVPVVIYALFAGGLSDDIGRKPLLIIPLIGNTLTSLLEILNLIFIDVFPTEVFYVEQVHNFLGGGAVYYLGFYGYGTSATNAQERTSRLARFDGVEQTGALIGTFLSPVLFSAIGYLGCYSLRSVLYFLAVLYVTFIVKEPITKKDKIFKTTIETPDGVRKMTCLEVFWEGVNSIVIRPIIGMIKTVIRKRPHNLQLLLWIQLVVFALYWFFGEESALLYLYAIKALPGYDGTFHSYYLLMMRIIGMLTLLFFIPLLSSKIRLHDSLVLVFVNFITTFGTLITAFAQNIWQFFVCQIFLAPKVCQFSIARSLMTKCVDSNEVGKLFSFVAVLAALVPLASNPIFRQLYNATIKTFPSAFLLFAASVSLSQLYMQFYVYTQKRHLIVDETTHTTDDPDLDEIELEEKKE